jgi:hypothetical protein
VSRDCYGIFHKLATIIADSGTDVNVTSIRNVISDHLTNLAERFEFYFPAEEDPRKGTGWIRNPFIPLKDDSTVTLEAQLFELAADGGLKMSFKTTTSLASFWIKVKAEYPKLAEIALKTLLPIP